MDGFYIAPAFMDKVVVHITKNFMNLPNIKVGSRILQITSNVLVTWFMTIFQKFG